jgi:hypothetical protein
MLIDKLLNCLIVALCIVALAISGATWVVIFYWLAAR